MSFLDSIDKLDIVQYQEIKSRDDEFNWALQLTFFRINKICICTGQILAKDKYVYKSVIPFEFRPKKNINFVGQCVLNKDVVSTATAILGYDGKIFTEYPYPNMSFIATVVYEVY